MIGHLRTKINKLKIFYLTILGMLFAVFIVLAFLNVTVKRANFLSDIYVSPLTFEPERYPQVENKYEPIISAQGAVVLDKDSKVPLFEKNPNLRFSPASTTKIMTALVALDYFNPGDILTISQTYVEGSVIGFRPQERFTFEDLAYAMLLPSANDATASIAQNYPGGEEAFVAKMNEKAKQLYLMDTYYEDPIGLLDEQDYTSAMDLARLSAIALQNPIFAKIVSTKSRQIRSLEGNQYLLYNLNKLLDLPGVNGVKTGTTQGAGQVLVTSRRIEDKDADLIIVVMQSTDRFGDTKALLNYLDQNLNYLSTHP
ncbi:MAG: D-alanyl-D-alanine carboxypeptidase [Candidatus Levybacteria bacterium]|nr:D-alanyl-D-alanine carboxypeptidase [Candidatus Levybacteria bacterium]